MSYQYDKEFFDFVNESSGRSAAKFLAQFSDKVFPRSRIQTVLDVGCGRGVWVAEWLRMGVPRVLGIDGDYVPRESLLIPQDMFQSRDISMPFDLGIKFDLVECLEVAEHVPDAHADTLVANLVRHGDVVLFSAAIPGQGGEFHVNEQPYGYWRDKFARQGYRLHDAIRTHVAGEMEIEPWYRYNAFVFANELGRKQLTGPAQASACAPGAEIANVAPLGWRFRCAVIAMLPPACVSMAARLKHGIVNRLG